MSSNINMEPEIVYYGEESLRAFCYSGKSSPYKVYLINKSPLSFELRVEKKGKIVLIRYFVGKLKDLQAAARILAGEWIVE